LAIAVETWPVELPLVVPMPTMGAGSVQETKQTATKATINFISD
jgi:hypothetical protein